MLTLRSFPPVVSAGCRVLILGSMPGEASLRAGQYYAHPRNAFWPIMGRLCGAGPDLAYPQRLERLLAAGIGLWDVLQSCVRAGSLDSAIRDEVANDLPALFAAYPRIDRVFFNGAKAGRHSAGLPGRCCRPSRPQWSGCPRPARRMPAWGWRRNAGHGG